MIRFQTVGNTCAAMMMLAAATMPGLGAEPQVRTVPWVAADPSIPHDTYAYRKITLKGTSNLAGPSIRATWDFGDGTEPVSFAVRNQYDVSTAHVYYGHPGTTYIARLTVVDTETGESGSAAYLVAMRERALNTEVNVAIDEGLWALHTSMSRARVGQVDIGSWTADSTAWNVLAFERHGHLESGDSSDPYTETVARGMRSLLQQLEGSRTADKTLLDAIRAAASPNAVAVTGPDGVAGQTYRQILADRISPATATDDAAVSEPQLSDIAGLPIRSLYQLSRVLSPALYTADTANGDLADGVARTLIRRQSTTGTWPQVPTDSAHALLLLDKTPARAAGVNSVLNVTAQVNITTTGFAFNRTTNTFTGTMTVTNTSGQPIPGPVTVGLHNITSGVTLVNGNGTFNGAPYVSVGGTTPLNAGASATALLRFSNPSNAIINFTRVAYSGTFPPAALSITCPTATATNGSPYSSSLSADGGVQAYIYSIGPGSLPNNLVLNPSTGAITGTPDTSGLVNFTAKVTDSAGGTAQTATQSCSINVTGGLSSQTISFTSTAPVGATVGGSTYNVTATATSSLPVSFTIDASASSVCSIVGSTVSFIGVGTCVINANQSGNGSFSAAPQVQQSFAVGKGNQTITFTSSAPSNAVPSGPTYTVTATATSGLPVTFTIDATASAVCSISGSTVSFLSNGTCVINANQAGNANYNAAPQAQQSFSVGLTPQTITFTSVAPASATVGGPTYTVTATATSGLTVTFTIDATASAVCSISGSTVSFIGVGTCVINANQAGNATFNPAPQVQQSFSVGKASQTISFTSTAPVGATVGGATYNVTATATSGLTVTLTIDAAASAVCSISGSTVSFIGVGTCTINANQAGDATYNAAPQVQQSFAVGKGNQTISFTSVAPSGAMVNGPTYTVTATATSGLTVAFTSNTPSICTLSGSTVSFIAVGTCTINANQAGDANYNPASQVQQSFSVAKGDQTISFTSTAPANALVAGPTYTVTATATSGLTVTFTIDASATAVCSISGATVSFLAGGTCIINANQAGNANFNAAPQVQQSFQVNQPPSITSANTVTFAPGKTGQSFTVTTTGFPTNASMVITESGALPTGVSFTNNNNGTATINGVPAAGTQGVSGNPRSQAYPLTIGADNGIAPAASQSFTLNITCPVINVTGSATLGAIFGVAMTSSTYNQTGGNGTIVWSATGLPTNITIGSGTGTVSGTPNVTGTFSVTITATDAGGCQGSTAVTLSVGPNLSAQAYTGVGNTQFFITGVSGAPATPAVSSGSGLLTGATPSGQVTITNATCSVGGSISFDAAGLFVFTPNVSATSATCTYTGSSNTGAGSTGPASTTANLSFTLSNEVWYVNGGGSNGDGRSHSPFNNMTNANTSSSTNDYVFVHTGSGTTTGAITLEAGQTLWGQGTLFTLGGLSIAAGTKPTLGGTVTIGGNNVTISSLNISTGTSTGLTNSGTVTGATVQNNVNVTTTTGTAVSLSNTSGTMTFGSINTNGANIGMSLTSTNLTFSVNGDNSGLANGSGGALANSGLGGGATSAAMNITNASGTINLKSMNFGMNTAADHGVYVDNTGSGSLAVNITGGIFTGVTASVSQNKALLQFDSGNAASLTANVQNSFFNGSRTYGLAAGGVGTSTLNLTVNQSGFGTNVNTGAAVNQPGTSITNAPAFGLLVGNGAGGNVHYDLTNNTFWGASGSLGALYAVTISGAVTTGGSQLNGFFTGNRIGLAGTTGSGCSGSCAGLGLLPGSAGTFNTSVTNNNIRQVNSVGMNLINSLSNSSVNIIAHITGNTIAEPDLTGGPAFNHAIAVRTGNSGGGVSSGGCANIASNSISGGWQASQFIRLSTLNSTGTLVLPGLSPSTGATTTQINTFVSGLNSATSVNSTIGGPINGGAACTPTP